MPRFDPVVMFSCNARESCDHSKAQAGDADLSKHICPSTVHREAELPHHSRSKRVSEETASRICGWWLVTAAGGANRACCRRGQYPQLKLPFNFLAKQSIVRDPALGTVVRLPKPLHALHCNLNDQYIRKLADVFVASGLTAAGYRYLNLGQFRREPPRAPKKSTTPENKPLPKPYHPIYTLTTRRLLASRPLPRKLTLAPRSERARKTRHE